MSSTMRPEGSLRWEPYTVIPESQLTRPDVGGLHRDHDHHRRGDQWHGGDQGRSCGIEQETGVSSSGELFNKGTHQIRGWAVGCFKMQKVKISRWGSPKIGYYTKLSHCKRNWDFSCKIVAPRNFWNLVSFYTVKTSSKCSKFRICLLRVQKW